MLIVGTEWLVEASGCDPAALRDAGAVRAVFERAVAELRLSVVGQIHTHKFPGEGGVTCMAMLTESHLACHTYPEFRIATFNLYCCRARPRWEWEERLAEMLGACDVSVREIVRRAQAGTDEHEGDGVNSRGAAVEFVGETESEAAFGVAFVESAFEAGGRGR